MFALCVALVAAVAVSVARAGCAFDDWKEYDKHCYWKSAYGLTWYDAKNVCSSTFLGATLVSIHSADQNSFISENVLDGHTAWIGLRCTDTVPPSCTWEDGSPYNFTNWSGGGSGPSCYQECCADINHQTNAGDWAAYDCYETYKVFMCQLDAT